MVDGPHVMDEWVRFGVVVGLLGVHLQELVP